MAKKKTTRKKSSKATPKKQAACVQSMHGAAFAIVKKRTEETSEYPGETVGAQTLARFMAHNQESKNRIGSLFHTFALWKAKKMYRREVAQSRLRGFLRKEAKRYAKEVKQVNAKKGSRLFSTCDLEKLSRDLERDFSLQWAMGLWESVLPLKLQKKSTRQATAAALGAA